MHNKVHVPEIAYISKLQLVYALWSRITKNPDVNAGPPFLLCLRALLHSFVRLLTHSRAGGKVNDQMPNYHAVLNLSALGFCIT